MSTIRGHGKIATDSLNQAWKKELPWIHPTIPLIPAVLKKIREEQIEVMLIAPLSSDQTQYTEQVNEKVQSFIFGCSIKILEPGQEEKKIREKDFENTKRIQGSNRHDFIWIKIQYPKKILLRNGKAQEMDPNQSLHNT
ncbi:MAG: hypothetical protein EZS28_035549 [Streblomastix strix]|uniref:Uncharacterized protein n=1 Tax=Streblomastix strix TaxID=222440 RepID=A0A5J4UHA1_9EUKA|nr:MAG: hypothetical protein EZS28_035549 [Streblomastix strix]